MSFSSPRPISGLLEVSAQPELAPPVPSLANGARSPQSPPAMWNDPYLESCCRSALHRLVLTGKQGRPVGFKDGPCLVRLAAQGLARREQERFLVCDEGLIRHAHEILHKSA